jgi:very-short-patch-repair endonuclease
MRENDYRRRDFEIFRAREMRKEPTPAECKLWSLLRRKHFGVRFRRQQPIGPFVVDFYCSPARLVIELDGGHHTLEDLRARDAERAKWLGQKGYSVLRFRNDDVLTNSDSVIHRILAAMVERGLPPPI